MTAQLQSDILVCAPMDAETCAAAAAYVRRQPDPGLDEHIHHERRDW